LEGSVTPILQPVDWGMRWARPPVVHNGMPVAEVYIHQTAGRDPVEIFPSGDDRPQDAFKALNEWAIDGKGYSAVDYSAMVHTGPSLRTTIGIARGKYLPAATLDRNTVSKAICLLGWYGPPDPRYAWTYNNSREPFDQELRAIAETVVYMIDQGWLVPNVKILGHRDNPAHPGATGCPGDYLEAELPTIRRYVTELLEEEPVAVQYFKTAPDSLTIWATSDGLNAVRLEEFTVKARGIDVFAVAALPAGEAAKFVYQAGLTSQSVK
jgi:hypothetical protein